MNNFIFNDKNIAEVSEEFKQKKYIVIVFFNLFKKKSKRKINYFSNTFFLRFQTFSELINDFEKKSSMHGN